LRSPRAHQTNKRSEQQLFPHFIFSHGTSSEALPLPPPHPHLFEALQRGMVVELSLFAVSTFSISISISISIIIVHLHLVKFRVDPVFLQDLVEESVREIGMRRQQGPFQDVEVDGLFLDAGGGFGQPKVDQCQFQFQLWFRFVVVALARPQHDHVRSGQIAVHDSNVVELTHQASHLAGQDRFRYRGRPRVVVRVAAILFPGVIVIVIVIVFLLLLLLSSSSLFLVLSLLKVRLDGRTVEIFQIQAGRRDPEDFWHPEPGFERAFPQEFGFRSTPTLGETNVQIGMAVGLGKALLANRERLLAVAIAIAIAIAVAVSASIGTLAVSFSIGVDADSGHIRSTREDRRSRIFLFDVPFQVSHQGRCSTANLQNGSLRSLAPASAFVIVVVIVVAIVVVVAFVIVVAIVVVAFVIVVVVVIVVRFLLGTGCICSNGEVVGNHFQEFLPRIGNPFFGIICDVKVVPEPNCLVALHKSVH